MKLFNKIRSEKQFDSIYATNIFDFNYIARQRNARSDEIFAGNSIYSMGYSLRKYSQYDGPIYCASEHGLPAGSSKDLGEYKNNKQKLLLVMSNDRRKFLQSKTDKLLIPIGPSIMPYCTNIYSDFVMEAIKRNLGKTLLVFPQHSCADSECLEEEDDFICEIKELISRFKYDSVLVCLYYEDIRRGEFIKYQKQGWIVVTAGHKHNYDFADCLKTIINFADDVVTQGYGSSAIYSIYLKKRVFYFTGNRGRKIESKGVFEDKNPWMQPYEDKLSELSNVPLELIAEKQWEWANEVYGFSETLSPEQFRELFELARLIKKKKKVNDEFIRKRIETDKFKEIRALLEEAMQYRTGAFFKS